MIRLTVCCFCALVCTLVCTFAHSREPYDFESNLDGWIQKPANSRTRVGSGSYVLSGSFSLRHNRSIESGSASDSIFVPSDDVLFDYAVGVNMTEAKKKKRLYEKYPDVRRTDVAEYIREESGTAGEMRMATIGCRVEYR
jgi:hypothetical protein